jgi:hypothetical protein
MIKNNYYNLPSISCSDRLLESRSSSLSEKKKVCEGYNASKIYDTYFLNPSSEIPERFKTIYANYPKNGKVGDYQCEFDASAGSCNIINHTSCAASVPDCIKKAGKPIKKPSSGGPLPSPCLPPGCGGSVVKKQIPGQLINNRLFPKCQKQDLHGNNNCINSIYTANSYGNPTPQNYSNAPNRNLLYSKAFSNLENKDIVNCPSNQSPYEYQTNNFLCCPNTSVIKGPSGSQTCSSKGCAPRDLYPKNFLLPNAEPCSYPLDNWKEMYLTNSPVPTAFKTNDQCKDWCTKDALCKGVSWSPNTKGDVACTYYKHDRLNYATRIKPRKGFTTSFKADEYETEPDNLPRPVALDPANDDTYSSGEFCPDGITKTKDGGSNCLFPINKATSKEPILQSDPYIGGPSPGFPYHMLGGGRTDDIINKNSGTSYLNQLENRPGMETFSNNHIEHFCDVKLDQCSNRMRFIILLSFIIIAGLCLKHHLR